MIIQKQEPIDFVMIWVDGNDPEWRAEKARYDGKKVTTKNVMRIGKHSELLAITDDPLAYAKEQVRKYNQEYKEGKAEVQFKIDFEEKL